MREVRADDRSGHARACGVVTLLTDFGAADVYAGVLRGVILRLAPEVRIVDLTHEVPAHDARLAALHLEDALPYFPEGTVHLVVVDPGVGTDRRGIAVVTQDAFGVGPDNGVLTPLLARGGRAIELTAGGLALEPLSRTFHGRDLFAPAAAALARGDDPGTLGSAVEDAIRLSFPEPALDGDAVTGEILHVDRFGNLITNVRAALLAGWGCFWVEVGETLVAGPADNYRLGDEPLRALFGSTGRLEIALREGSAACSLGIGTGDAVTVRRDVDGGEHDRSG